MTLRAAAGAGRFVAVLVVVALVIGVVALGTGLVWFARRESRTRLGDTALRTRGIRGAATVVEARGTGHEVGGSSSDDASSGVAGNPVMALRVVVELPGQAPYEVHHRTAAPYLQGIPMVVWVDRVDPQRIFLDLGASLPR
jgi:hypothetical protein